ncbi:MAG: histidine kinase, partial [Nitrospirae bacterium]|nr:histidine kinase [Nitrospirota bacterium]
DKEGFTSALEELAANTEKMFGIPCIFRYDAPVIFRDKSVVTQLFRIAQESITNAVKHGRPKQIEIYLSKNKDNFIMMIKDDGIGISDMSGQSGGMGLRIMKYRAGLINASLDVQQDANGGTIVKCIIPA